MQLMTKKRQAFIQGDKYWNENSHREIQVAVFVDLYSDQTPVT